MFDLMTTFNFNNTLSSRPLHIARLLALGALTALLLFGATTPYLLALVPPLPRLDLAAHFSAHMALTALLPLSVGSAFAASALVSLAVEALQASSFVDGRDFA